MGNLISVLLKFLGVGLPAIINEIQKERTKQLDAKTEQEKIASEERIQVLEAKKNVILASYNDRFNNIVRFIWAVPFIVYVWKLIIWDKVLGWGATDSLSPTLEYILWTILGGYFLLAGIDKLKR